MCYFEITGIMDPNIFRKPSPAVLPIDKCSGIFALMNKIICITIFTYA